LANHVVAERFGGGRDVRTVRDGRIEAGAALADADTDPGGDHLASHD
jgi:hypothetical protein